MTSVVFLIVLTLSVCFANQQIRYRDPNQNAGRVKAAKRLFRDTEPEQNQVVSPPGTAPDYSDHGMVPQMEGPLLNTPPAPVTEVSKEAQVTAFAHVVERQATESAGNENNPIRSTSFFFELVRAISDLGHGVFSLLGLATGGS